MVNKRGRKRVNEMYFGPNEEDAVIKFLNSRYIETIDLFANKEHTIKHNLGKDVVVNVSYTIPNENWYGNDNKFLTINIDVETLNLTDTSLDILSNISISGATIIVSDDILRNTIFNEWLKGPLDKMIEAIIRRYKLYRKGETFEELHSDTVSFLMTKVHKFEPSLGKKAYSYFGTISKNYIIGLLIKDEKYLKQNSSYEDISDYIEERDDLIYFIDEDEFSMDIFMKKISDGIKSELTTIHPPKKTLNENEIKVGQALIEILDKWEIVFESMGGSKYNKNSVLETMREYTLLSTKDIRLSMKRFKTLYKSLKQFGI